MIYKNSKGVTTRVTTMDTTSPTALNKKDKRFTIDFPDVITGSISYGKFSLIDQCNQFIRNERNRKPVLI